MLKILLNYMIQVEKVHILFSGFYNVTFFYFLIDVLRVRNGPNQESIVKLEKLPWKTNYHFCLKRKLIP